MPRSRTETKVGDVRISIERRDGKWDGHVSVTTLDEAGSPFHVENQKLPDALMALSAAERTAFVAALKKVVAKVAADLAVPDVE